MNRARTTILLVVLSTLVFGCRTGPYFGERYERLHLEEPLPFSVKLNDIEFVDAAGRAIPMDPDDEGAPLLLSRRSALRAAIRDSMEQFRSVAWVIDDAVVDTVPADLELTVRVTRATDRSLGSVELSGAGWVPNLVLWFFAGVPSWIIKDTEIDQGVSIEYALSLPDGQPQQGPLVSGEVEIVDDTTHLNFWERSTWPQFLLNILIPPFLISPDEATADRSLTEGYLIDAQAEVGGAVKEQLLEQWILRRRAILHVASPKPGVRGQGVQDLAIYVLSDETPVEIRVHRVKRSGAVLPVYSGPIAPVVEAVSWQELNARLGSAARHLPRYGQRFLLEKIGVELDNFAPGEGDFLRVEVDIESDGERSTTSWTHPY